ncbi:Metalloenzyme, LuxS/M16 peptidase-like protein [Spinellus fusiger]|nr:Metalloenzyme, LuxS/M16 peptidase-like protein [Spinellus fusiger]
MSHFKILCQVPSDHGATFTKYKSEKTGLTVVLCDIEGFDDFGCPHTLEHLVFLGSEQYPYKGVLDSLANRAIAQGTNAWTDVDHTCYTITTAGSEGFLRLLPIYVDHVLYPTLTESGYYTEVHHINGEGQDAGRCVSGNDRNIETTRMFEVVYSEMQSSSLRMKRILHPETCGYRSETGGLWRDCVNSLLRKVDPAAVLKALEPVEENIISKGPLPPMQRPWVSTGDFPDVEKSSQETVWFADEDESMGTVMIAWNGPRCHEYLEIKALEVLSLYLTDSPVSVLQREFVEIEDPLCTGIEFDDTDHLKSTLRMTASNVPMEEIDEFPDQFFEVLQQLINKQDIDLQRMATIIEKEALKVHDNAETDAHENAAFICIRDFLYGALDGKDLATSVKDIDYLHQLANYTVQDWIQVMKKWYIDQAHITLIGKPSASFAEQMTEEENNRIEKQRTDLGEDKLKELQNRLEKAMAANDVPLPSEILTVFTIPSVSTIDFINVPSARNTTVNAAHNKVQEYINSDAAVDIPLFIQFDHINSSFINVSAHVSACSIPSHLLPYTRLFLKSIFSLPIEREGVLVSYEEVVKELSKDTLEYNADVGTGAGFRELAVFTIKVEVSKYTKAIQWLKNIMWNTQFTVDRLKIVASQILNDVPQAKRDGHGMVSACMRALQYDASKSISAARNILYQSTFLQSVLERLETDPAVVLEDLNNYRQALCHPKNIRVHVAGNILKLEAPCTSFRDFPLLKNEDILAPIPLAQQVLSAAGQCSGQMGVIVALPSIENSFSMHSVKGPHQFNDPNIAPLLVMIELLDTMEGIFWKLIRGQGLAYSCYLAADIESGDISFTIYQSPDAFKAFEQAKRVVDQLAHKEIDDINPSAVDGAKSAVIYSMVASEKTMDSAALQSFVCQVLKNMPMSYNRDLLAAVQAVTIEDLYRVLDLYFVPMFNPATSNHVVISTPAKVTDMQKGFEQLGFQITSMTLNEIAESGSQ